MVLVKYVGKVVSVKYVDDKRDVSGIRKKLFYCENYFLGSIRRISSIASLYVRINLDNK